MSHVRAVLGGLRSAVTGSGNNYLKQAITLMRVVGVACEWLRG
jgi:hypothetical protein